jgi:serine/threonine protein phosphatase PrpC
VEGLWDHAVASHLARPRGERSAADMVIAALDGGSRDNTTAVVVRVG